ncbi:MAG: excisionase family DNA-binding protein [Acidimicrobiales bacterium]|jgi:excisionase family DNA binding protein
MTVVRLNDLMVLDSETAASAADATEALSAHLRRHPTPSGRVVLCVEDAPEVRVAVPAAALKLFIDVLDELSKGNAVTVAPVHAELTTQRAADLLNVSRPYLIGLLESGQLEFRKVGSHRRVRLIDVLEHQRKDENRRRQVQRGLTREAEDAGLYGDD